MNKLHRAPKVWLSVVLSVLMLVSSVMILPASAATRGDMNGDGTLNMMDALLLYSITGGTTVMDDTQKDAADYDGDGAVNMMDAVLLYQVASGNMQAPDTGDEGELVTYTVGSAESVAVGDTVTIDLSVTDGHCMVNGQLYVAYDPAVLELQPVVDDEDNPYFEYNSEIFKNAMCMSNAEDPGLVKFAFATSREKGSATGGVLYTLTFKVIAEAAQGTAITLTIPEMVSNNGESNGGNDYDTRYEIVNGVVTTA